MPLYIAFVLATFIGICAGVSPDVSPVIVGLFGVLIGVGLAAAVAFSRKHADVIEAKARATPDPSDDAPAAAQAAAWRAIADALERKDLIDVAAHLHFVWPSHPAAGPPPAPPSSPAPGGGR